MPTPLEILLDPISIAVIAMYAGLILWEAIWPAKTLPEVKGWRFRGIAAFAAFFYLSSYLPLLWDQYLIQYQLIDLTNLGTIGGAVVGLLVIELAVYSWHYCMHRSDFLWRVFHQMHHSAERLDTFGAFWFSPMDMIAFTALGSISLGLLVGISPQASTVVLLTTTFLTIFQHANVKTPYWLGFIVQRPESHSYHHAKGVHTGNFADISLFDILLGTFYNPKEFVEETGFYPGASSRVWEMVTFRDVTQDPSEELVEAISLPEDNSLDSELFAFRETETAAPVLQSPFDINMDASLLTTLQSESRQE